MTLEPRQNNMTPQQFLNVDPTFHTAANLVDVIAIQLSLHSMHVGYSNRCIVDWILACTQNNEEAAYSLARQVVRALRSDKADALMFEIEDSIAARRAPQLA